MLDVHKKCCQLLVENIRITTAPELPTEKVVANMLAAEESVCVWRALDSTSRYFGDHDRGGSRRCPPGARTHPFILAEFVFRISELIKVSPATAR